MTPIVSSQTVIHFDGNTPSAVLRAAADYLDDRRTSKLDDTDIEGVRYHADFDHFSPCRLTLMLYGHANQEQP